MQPMQTSQQWRGFVQRLRCSTRAFLGPWTWNILKHALDWSDFSFSNVVYKLYIYIAIYYVYIYTVYVIIYIYRLGLEFGLMRLQQHVPWGFDSRVVTIGVWLSWFTLLRDFSPETPVLPFHQNAIFDLNFCYLAICYLGASSENH